MRKYWLAFRNDGDAITGIERATKAQAINDCKEAFKNDPSGDYYIEQYEELEGIAAVMDMHLLKLTVDKNGSIRCERKDNDQ